MSTTYEETAHVLVNRIYALIPAHPEILTFDDPWKLFKVPGFQCDDIGPSMAQAMVALGIAQQRWKHR